MDQKTVVTEFTLEHESPTISTDRAPDEESPFDYEKLLKQWKGKTEFVAKVLTTFGREAEKDLEQIARSFAAGDREELARLAHRLKGAAATVGVEPMRAHAARLESLSRCGSPADLSVCIANLRRELERYERTARTRLAGV